MRILSVITALFLSTSILFGFNKSPLPTDSSTTVANKLAAVYLIGEGRKAMELGRTQDALRRFREAYVRDQYNYKTSLWIGEAHYVLNNYGYALNYAKIAQALDNGKDGEVYFLLASAYHRLNELDSASLYYGKAETLLPALKRSAYNIRQAIKEVEYAQSLESHKTKFEKKLLGDNINSGYDDYCAVLTADGKEMYYVSRRPDTKGAGVNPDDQRYFEDIYYTKWNEQENDWGEATNELGRLNSDGFDALSHLSEDGNTAYLTINTSVLNISKTTKSSDICISEKNKEGKWSVPKPIANKSINTTFFDGAPTLTADGNTMYFVSDRDGDRSKSDIYVVYRTGKKWGTAKKLPMNVNTKENETTPFITPDGRFLFFSSNGKTGMGGYDIYVTEKVGNEWTDPVNLGPDFNTVNDDIFFKYYPKFQKAVMSTYRVQGDKSSLDIFEVEVENWDIIK